MKIYKLLISKIIFFIIIFIIALIFFFIKNKKIEKFAIDKVNMRVTDDNKALTGILINNLLIYLKFNTGDFTNGNQIIQHGNYKYNAKNIDSNYTLIDFPANPIITCSANSSDYVKGDASIEFKGSTGLIQEMLSSHLKTNFTIAFFIKNPDYNVSGFKTIVCQALQNPTLGWLMRINNTKLEVVLGTNIDDTWITIISKEGFISNTGNDWYHVALTYNNSTNPKWNLYLDGIRENLPINDNINKELKYLDTSYLTINNGIVTNFKFNDNMHFLSIGCQITNNSRNLITILNSSLNIEYLNIKFPLGKININYNYSDIAGGDYFYIKFISGSSQINIPVNCTADILIVGGGGGGGSRHAGGGGAGAVIYLTNQTLTMGTYEIYVGNGGYPVNYMGQGGRGENTSIVFNGTNLYLAQGGGSGNHSIITGNNNKNGGSGGGHGGGDRDSWDWRNTGRGHAVTNNIPNGVFGNHSGLGTNGGRERHWSGGGGGGAGSMGTDGYYTQDRAMAGNGGMGVANSITGYNEYYGGGGGGGCASDSLYFGSGGIGGGGAGSKGPANATNGAPNTGGGGGGAGFVGGSNGLSGSGGSGVVIIRLKKSNFFAFDKPYYQNAERNSMSFRNFLPNGTLMDDFRVYDKTLSENEIKSVYYGRNITSSSSTIPNIDTSSGSLTDDTSACINNSLGPATHLTPVIDISISSSSEISIQDEVLRSYRTPMKPQFSQTFSFTNLFSNKKIELLFSQPLSSSISKNPYTPVKLFNNDSAKNINENYCAFLSTYALISNNITYNYDVTTGDYALTEFKVPDCGSFVFNEGSRPIGDYIYIKFPEAFVLKRYAFTAIPGFANRAPGQWTIYFKNSSISVVHPDKNKLKLEDYCQINNRTYYVDINWASVNDEPITNEYLFVFHKIVGNNPNDKYGILAFQEIKLYKSNTALTLDTTKSAI